MIDVKQAAGLSLVIPCYNESGRVGLLYKGVEDLIGKWPGQLEVIIINDGSKDDTVLKLETHPVYKKHTGIISIYSQQNTGKGGALKNGVLKAKYELVLTLDADMATSPVELLNWFEQLNWQVDERTVYIGSREHKESRIINETAKRKLAGNIFNMLVRTLTPLKVNDSQCGFKLYPADAANKLFGKLQVLGWAHDVELLYRAHLGGMQIKEMPITWEAIEGSKIRLVRDAMKMAGEIFKITLTIKKD